MTINELIEKLVGQPFEIECSEIRIHGMLDHCPPVYQGPGVLTSGKDGKITFRMHNQIAADTLALSSLQRIKPEGGTEPCKQVRIVAADYNGVDWSGAWSIPRKHSSRGNSSVISGEFDQLTTRIPKIKGDKRKNLTEIVYGHTLDLPLAKWIETTKRRGRKVVTKEFRATQHDLDFRGSKISIFESENGKRTHVTSKGRPTFRPPHAEIWLADAIVFLTARLIYPRLWIRYFEDSALVFLRAAPSESRSGMPPPFAGFPMAELWELFILYLAECERQQKLGSVEISRWIHEVIIASTGTVQAFVLSLALCIENLVGQLLDELGVKATEEAQLQQLREHVSQWQGDCSVRERALGLLSMLGTKSVKEGLKRLKAEKTLTKKHIDAWKKIRNFLAHGRIIENPFDPIFWESRNLLIDMAYRLIFRKIGYEGLIREFLTNGAATEFKWRS
jgi:hypothetical protein